MSAEVLRRAASLMRERAEAAPAGSPWRVMSSRSAHRVSDKSRSGISMAVADVFPTGGSEHQRRMAEHIASWHPAVALAVADLLDTAGADIWAHGPLCECGTGCDACDDNLWEPHARAALTVARAYLGEAS